MTTTVKMDNIGKEKLEKLQAKLRLQADLKLDQYKILRTLIDFGEENYNQLITFIKGVKLTDEEIKEINSKYIIDNDDEYLYPEKSDDELIYGE